MSAINRFVTPYDIFNREERYYCMHLFRLLHENLELKYSSPLGRLLNLLSRRNLEFRNGKANLSDLKFEEPAIYSEVAFIRDTYHYRKPHVDIIMDPMTKLVARQESIYDFRSYSELPAPLNDPRKVHPGKLRQYARENNIQLTEDEMQLYGSIQGIFNAKPDFLIKVDNLLLVCEAKLTQTFEKQQLIRTLNIAQLWAELFYQDFGFNKPPVYTLFTIGSKRYSADITWTELMLISMKTYGPRDRTNTAFIHASSSSETNLYGIDINSAEDHSVEDDDEMKNELEPSILERNSYLRPTDVEKLSKKIFKSENPELLLARVWDFVRHPMSYPTYYFWVGTISYGIYMYIKKTEGYRVTKNYDTLIYIILNLLWGYGILVTVIPIMKRRIEGSNEIQTNYVNKVNKLRRPIFIQNNSKVYVDPTITGVGLLILSMILALLFSEALFWLIH